MIAVSAALGPYGVYTLAAGTSANVTITASEMAVCDNEKDNRDIDCPAGF